MAGAHAAAAQTYATPPPPAAPSPSTVPAASPSTTPTPSAAPSVNAIGPQLGANDPCTTISAIVGRPTVTSAVCTVRPNHVEIETGYTNTTFAAGGGNAVAYPQPVIRVGTTIPALEVQIGPPGASRTSAGGLASGATDAGAGLKYVFGYTSKFSWGGQVFFTAPTGTNGFSAGGATASYALNAAYTLSPVFSLATTLNSTAISNGSQHWTSFVPSFVVTAAFPSATGIFAEIATYSNANGFATPTRTQYLYGLYQDVGQRLQLDASVIVSPTTATGRYHGIGIGASYYF